MTIECYDKDCPYHGSNNHPDDGPFCDEDECKSPTRFNPEYKGETELNKGEDHE